MNTKNITLATLLILAVLLSSYQTFASTPDYSIVSNLITTTTNTSNLGTILFIKNNHIPENKVLSNYTTYNAQKFDIITWIEANSIEMTNPNGIKSIITPGNSYTLDTTGLYSFKQIVNDTNTGSIVVVAEQKNNMKVSFNSPTLTFNPISDFELLTEKTIQIITNISSNINPGDYPYQILISNGIKNTTLNQTLKVGANKDWYITKDNTSSTINVRAGDLVDNGYIQIYNRGNVNFEINATISGNGSSFLIVPSKQNVYKSSDTYFPVTIQVPSRQVNGNYSAMINFSDGTNFVTKNYTIIISDLIAPEIINVSFKGLDVAKKPLTISIEANDNIGLNRATIQIDAGPIQNITKDQQFFYYDVIMNDTKKHTFSYCVYDISENKQCNSIEHAVKYLDALAYNTSNNLQTKKVGLFERGTLFTLNETITDTINVSVKLFETDVINATISNYSINIVDGDGQLYPVTAIDQVIQVGKKGTIYIDVRSDLLSVYRLLVEVETPEYIEKPDAITMIGKFSTYTVPESQSRKWYNDYDMMINVVDTGDIDTSKIQVCTEYPITDSLDDISIPTTIREKKLEEQLHNQTITEYKTRETYYLSGIFALIVIAILLIVAAMYISAVYPYARMRK